MKLLEVIREALLKGDVATINMAMNVIGRCRIVELSAEDADHIAKLVKAAK
jgi:hypothetical protein